MSKIIKGVLEPYFETGTEGVIWSILMSGKKGYAALYTLKKGDKLKVLRSDKVVWKGVIKPEYKRNWREYPMNPGCGQQYAEMDGIEWWCHWLQDGVSPKEWAGWFSDGLKAEVVPKH